MDGVPTASTIRQYCDGELARADADRLEATIAADPALAERVRCERRLRSSIADVLRADCPCAPEGLAERVQSAFAQQTRRSSDPAPPRASRFRLAELLRGPQQANAFAVAATITLVLGAVLVGIFGTPIDSWEWNQPGVNLVDRAVPFICKEHGRCSDSPAALARKTVYHEPAETARELSDLFGAEVDAVPMCERLDDAGLTFVGGGPCAVPVSDRSAHMMFEIGGMGGSEMVSIFMIPDTGRYDAQVRDGDVLPVTPGRWIRVEATPTRREAWIYSDGRLVYMLVGPPPLLEEVAGVLQGALGR